MQQQIRKFIHHNQVAFIHLIHHINRTKDKNHMIISIAAEKAFDNIQQRFILKLSIN